MILSKTISMIVAAATAGIVVGSTTTYVVVKHDSDCAAIRAQMEKWKQGDAQFLGKGKPPIDLEKSRNDPNALDLSRSLFGNHEPIAPQSNRQKNKSVDSNADKHDEQ